MNRIHELDASSRHFVVNHTFIDVVEQEETSPRLALRRWKRVCTSPDLASLNCGAKEEEDEASLSCGTNEGEGEVRGLASTQSDTETSTEGATPAGSPLLCFARIKTLNPWESDQEDDEPIVTRNIDRQGYASSNFQSPITPTSEPDVEENANENARLALENARLANENACLALENENARLAFENELLRKQFMKSQGLQSNGCGSVQKSNRSVDNGLDQHWCFQCMMPSPMTAYIPQAAQTMTEDGKERTTVMLRNLPNNYTRAMFLSMLDSEGFNGAYDFVYLPIDFCSRACLGYAFVNLLNASIVPNFWRTFDGYSKWTLPSRKVCSVSWSGPHQGLEAHVERYRNSPVMHNSVPDEYKPVIFWDGTRVVFPTATKAFRAPRIRNSVKNGCHGSRTGFARAPRAAGTAMPGRTWGGDGAGTRAISYVQGQA
jgi:hypothetical protein